MESRHKMRITGEAGGTHGDAGVSPVGAVPSPVPDPAVPEKAQRRRFTAEYKLRMIREADACKAPGEIGASVSFYIEVEDINKIYKEINEKADR